MTCLTIGSLFSGIGGLELGLERAGLGRVIWQAESDAYCRSILRRHWPDARRFHDVRYVSADQAEQVDVICGGFPCQDVSVAGRGAGLAGERSGLWYEFARIVDEMQPQVVIVENVTHGQSRWLPFVVADLDGLGYDAAAVTVSAAAVGAPHLRARTFVIADADGLVLRYFEQRQPARPSRRVRDEGEAEPLDDGCSRGPAAPPFWASPPDVGGVGDGVPRGVDRSRADTDRLRVLGNAVVPQVAEAIGRAIVSALAGGE